MMPELTSTALQLDIGVVAPAQFLAECPPLKRSQEYLHVTSVVPEDAATKVTR